MKDIKERLLHILAQIESSGGDVRELVFAPPAEEGEIIKVEEEMGVKIPIQLRDYIKNVSRHCQLTWFLSDAMSKSIPDELQGVFSGYLHWGLHWIKLFNENKNESIEFLFADPNDSYNKIWHNKFVFLDTGCGDYIAIDLATDSIGKIVYLSHDDSEGHGVILANSFYEFIEKWVDLGCVGAEDWQWMKFVEDKTSGLNTTCENAVMWKKIVGLSNIDK